jgi:hypothetical protein
MFVKSVYGSGLEAVLLLPESFKVAADILAHDELLPTVATSKFQRNLGGGEPACAALQAWCRAMVSLVDGSNGLDPVNRATLIEEARAMLH